MKMFFKEEDKVTIIHYQHGNKEVSRQSIADYFTEDVLEEICEMVEGPYIGVEHKEVLTKLTEAATIFSYVPFMERITLIPNETVLKIKMENKSEDFKVEVSEELYNFLKELN